MVLKPVPRAAAAPSAADKTPAEELTELVKAAQADLIAVADVGAMRRDPYRFVLVALAKVTEIFGKAASRELLTPDEKTLLIEGLLARHERGAYDAVRQQAARMVRTLDRNQSIRIGLGIGAAYVLGGLSVLGFLLFFAQGSFSESAKISSEWRALMQNNPDPRPALAAANVQVAPNSTRRYYSGVSLWLDPPPAPPAKP